MGDQQTSSPGLAQRRPQHLDSRITGERHRPEDDAEETMTALLAALRGRAS